MTGDANSTGSTGRTGRTTTGGYHRPERVAVVTVEAADTEEPRVYLSAMPHSPVLVLDRSAADIWRAAVEVHDPRAVVAAVAKVVGADVDEIHDDVMGFLGELRDDGLLEWREAPEPG